MIVFDQVLWRIQLHLFVQFVLVCSANALINVFDIDPDMTHSDHDGSAVTFNLQEASLLELVVESEHTPTRREEIPCMLEQVESDQVAANQGTENFDPLW